MKLFHLLIVLVLAFGMLGCTTKQEVKDPILGCWRTENQAVHYKFEENGKGTRYFVGTATGFEWKRDSDTAYILQTRGTTPGVVVYYEKGGFGVLTEGRFIKMNCENVADYFGVYSESYSEPLNKS
ncbi:MAG: hypothetical protein V1909_03300 [Candidatus Micrarchaeota archaeon]